MLQRRCTAARGPRPTASPVPGPTIRIAGAGQNMTHTPRHGGCGASRAAGVIASQQRPGGSTRRRRPRLRSRPLPLAAAAAACRRARARVPLPPPGHLGTPDLGAGMRQLRAPDTPPGARSTASCSRPAFPRGRVEGRGHIARAGTRRAARAMVAHARSLRVSIPGRAIPSRAKTGLRSSRPAWTGSVRVPGAGQFNERELQFFSEGREHAPAEGVVATQGVATAPAT